MISENPPILRLRFNPSGRNRRGSSIIEKKNICVVCGTTENLTKHHIIPYSFMRYMRLHDLMEDIVALCDPCHRTYEIHADKKRESLGIEFGISVHGHETELMKETRKAASLARGIVKHGHKISESKLEKMKKDVENITGIEFHNQIDKVMEKRLKKMVETEFVTLSKKVCENIEDFDEFARSWREHFISTMKPIHMPEDWHVDRKIQLIPLASS